MNTVFVHTHFLSDGSAVSHSHPYLPSSHHSQSEASLLSIAQYNADVATMEGSASYGHTLFKTGWKDCSCDVIVRFIKILYKDKCYKQGTPRTACTMKTYYISDIFSVSAAVSLLNIYHYATS